MLAAIYSCSVKEDRSDCPCWMQVDASQITADAVQVRGWWGTRQLFKEDYAGNNLTAFHEYTVPRGMVYVSALHGADGLSEDGGILRITPGHQMDSLFASSSPVNTVCESTVAAVKLHKNFATVTLVFKEIPGQAGNDGIGYDLEVLGSVDGVDIRTLEPVEGSFRCVPEPSKGPQGYDFRVPRQKDTSLQVLLKSPNDGEIVRDIPVGGLIEKAHFDWTAPALGDITILADLPANTFTITVKEWEGPVSMTITI